MALLAPISHGFLEEDTGATGLYIDETGVISLRSTPNGALVPLTGGAGSPLILTAGDANETPLTIVAASGQIADLVQVVDEFGNMVAELDEYGTLRLSAADANASPAIVIQGPFGGSGGVVITATTVTVKDSAGAHVFEVRDDDSVHILTGTSVIADL